MIFRARQFEFVFPRPTLIMGVLNVTPDSFSDAGQFFRPAAAIDRALAMVDEGADLIDIGGESTRPHATPVPEAEELRRVLPVFEGLSGRLTVPLSIDTMKPAVARAALNAGAAIVNDVGANRTDPALWRLVAETGAGYVAMHMQGTPATMQSQPRYADVVAEVNAFLGERLGVLAAAGVAPEQVVLDVGLGFGKTPEHNLQLLAHLDSFTKWRRPLVLGASRKSFIARAAGETMSTSSAVGAGAGRCDDAGADRLGGSVACACWGVGRGINIVRTHDVAATRQAIRLLEAIAARQDSR